MTKAEWEAVRGDNLMPGEWTEVYIDEAMPMFKRRYYCGDCGEYNTYGYTPFCPYCGMRKRVAGKLGGKP